MALTKATRVSNHLVSLNIGTLDEGIPYVTPDMFGAVPATGSGNGDDAKWHDDMAQVNTEAINKAILYARDNKIPRVIGGMYSIASPVKVDNMAEGFRLELAGLKASSTWEEPSDWKESKGVVTVGSESNGSQAGMSIHVGYFHGRDKATLYQLKGYGCGASHFSFGRARNFVGLFEATKCNLFNATDNVLTIGHAGNGKFGIRAARNGAYVVEGTKLNGGFIQGCIYGALQLFNGAQYTCSMGLGVDFNGRYLAEYQVDATSFGKDLIRGGFISNGTKSLEVLDFYKYMGNTYRILCIEPMDVTEKTGQNPLSFNVGETLTIGSWSTKVTAVRRPGKDGYYPDVIHGFTGSPFAKCDLHFSYAGGVVGGLFDTSTLRWYNSKTAYTTIINGLRIRATGTQTVLEDVYNGKGLTIGATSLLFEKDLNIGDQRIRTTSSNVTLVQGEVKNIKSFAYSNDEAGSSSSWNLANVYRIIVKTPLADIGGEALLYVTPDGATIRAVGTSYITLGTKGQTLTAVQNTQANLNCAIHIQRI